MRPQQRELENKAQHNSASIVSPRLRSDSELVRRAAAGDATAFDALVARYRQTVLLAARVIVGEWELAEDVAQQTLLAAYRGLGALRDGVKFRPWLMSIMSRCAAQQKATILFTCELTEMTIGMPLAESPIDNELIERIRENLSELSSRNRQVIILHYLDGYSCQEVGVRLGISIGTVKHILHQSRNALRAIMGVSTRATRKGDRIEMETQVTKGPRRMSFWCRGSWPGPVMEGLLRQSICLAVNKIPKTARQIAQEVDTNIDYVLEVLTPLVDEVLVTKEDDRYRTAFIALDRGEWEELHQHVRPQVENLAPAIERCLPEFAAAWEHTVMAAQGISWDNAVWSVFALFLGCKALGRTMRPKMQTEPPVRNSGCRYWAGGRDGTGDGVELWSSSSFSSDQNYGVWWGGFDSYTTNLTPEHRFDWYTTNLTPEHRQVLDAVASAFSEIAQISAQICQPEERTREIISFLLENDLLIRQDKQLKLNFPFVTEQDDAALLPLIDATINRLYEDIIHPALSPVDDMLTRFGYGHLAEQFVQWKWWTAGKVFGESLHVLYDRGVLPHPPIPAPVNFAFIGWRGKPGLLA